MRAGTIDPAIARYVGWCDEHLQDLPEPVRAQLRLDIEEIVAEVCAELGGDPRDLVGPPLRFVAELRGAAGLAPPPAARVEEERKGRTVRRRLRRFWGHPARRWVHQLATDLRPAWWVARGVFLAIALAKVTGAADRPSWLVGLFPYWPLFGSRLLGLAGLAGAIFLSVEAGRRPLTRGLWLLRLMASIAAVVFAAVLAGEARSWADSGASYRHSYNHPPPAPFAPAPAFSPVVVGSDLTGDALPVVSLSAARKLVAELLVSSPPLALYIQVDGQVERPGTPASIEQRLTELASQGCLSE